MQFDILKPTTDYNADERTEKTANTAPLRRQCDPEKIADTASSFTGIEEDFWRKETGKNPTKRKYGALNVPLTGPSTAFQKAVPRFPPNDVIKESHCCRPQFHYKHCRSSGSVCGRRLFSCRPFSGPQKHRKAGVGRPLRRRHSHPLVHFSDSYAGVSSCRTPRHSGLCVVICCHFGTNSDTRVE